MDVMVHDSIDEANRDGVIVTLFRDFDGEVRGWHIGPVIYRSGVLIVPRSSPADRLSGAIALLKALRLSRWLKVELSLVDPDDLWAVLAGEITETSETIRPDDRLP